MIIYTYQWWKMVYCPLVTKPWSIEVTIWRSGSTRVDQSSRGAIQLHKWLFHQQKWLLDIGKYLKTTWNISRKWTFDWVLEPKFRGTKRRHISDDFDSDLAKREELLWSVWAVPGAIHSSGTVWFAQMLPDVSGILPRQSGEIRMWPVASYLLGCSKSEF